MSDQQSINVLYIWTTDDTGAMERHGFTKTSEGQINSEYVWQRYARGCERGEVDGILKQLADINTAHPSFVIASLDVFQ